MMTRPADVCLILEGTYPYVPGGVSAWTHDLITRQDRLTFHIVSILPRDGSEEMRYTLPTNVVGHTVIRLQDLPEGRKLSAADARTLFTALRPPLVSLTTAEAGLEDFRRIMQAVAPHRERIGQKGMLDSEEAWALVTSMYEASFAESSMLDYFWSWRAVMGGLYSLMRAELPAARCYHALSTGYAGLYAARAKVETGRPVILTEHGIYTNERRIEIASADWLEETASRAMTIDRTRLNLRDLWDDTFANYSRICYEAADHIITLFEGNQRAQIADGAESSRLRIIPNGIDIERYGSIEKRAHERPTVAMIGRVVPIKDVKNYLRACAMLHESIPELRAYVLGPLDEDESYVRECKALATHLGLDKTVTFTGRVEITDYLPEIDVVVFSSISEAQPLTILEAGACGIPSVATDVGACREMLLGGANESPSLGEGGIVAPPSNPRGLAEGVIRLLSDRGFYQSCANVMQQRVAQNYNRHDQVLAYRELYTSCMR